MDRQAHGLPRPLDARGKLIGQANRRRRGSGAKGVISADARPSALRPRDPNALTQTVRQDPMPKRGSSAPTDRARDNGPLTSPRRACRFCHSARNTKLWVATSCNPRVVEGCCETSLSSRRAYVTFLLISICSPERRGSVELADAVTRARLGGTGDEIR